jgi:hypothetical protein
MVRANGDVDIESHMIVGNGDDDFKESDDDGDDDGGSLIPPSLSNSCFSEYTRSGSWTILSTSRIRIRTIW